MARRRSGGSSKVFGLFRAPKKHKTAYEIGLLGVGGVVALFVGSRLIKPGIKSPPFHFPHFFGGGGAPHPRPHPMHRPMGPIPAKAHLANILPPRAGLPVGGRISGIAGGGYNFKWPSGRLNHPGGYGIAGGYYAGIG